MQKIQSRLTITLLFTALVLLTFFGTVFITSPIDFLYRGTTGLTTVRNIAQAAALLAVFAIFVAGGLVAVPTALQPAPWLRKVLYVLPVYTLGFALAGIISALLGVGTVGMLLNVQGVGPVTLSTVWLAVGGIVSTLAVVMAAARLKSSGRTLRFTVIVSSIAGVVSVIATIAMLVSVVMVSTSQPATFRPGGGPGEPPSGQNSGAGPGGNRPQGGQNAPPSGGANQSPQVTPEATANAPSGRNRGGSAPQTAQNAPPSGGASQSPQATPEATASAPSGNSSQSPQATPGQNQGGNRGQGRPDRPGNQLPPDGPGGPGGIGNVASRYTEGGVLMAVFAVLALGSTVSAYRAVRQLVTESAQPARWNFQREAGLAGLGCVGVTIVLLGISQLVPVSRTNPPVQTTIKWDSQQTQDLVYRACMNCHSNETTWPWYAYFAPASWLTTIHVNDARQQFNLSELSSLPGFRRSDLANEMAMQIRAGTMPPKDYLILHPEARLTDEQKAQLIQGLQASLGGRS